MYFKIRLKSDFLFFSAVIIFVSLGYLFLNIPLDLFWTIVADISIPFLVGIDMLS